MHITKIAKVYVFAVSRNECFSLLSVLLAQKMQKDPIIYRPSSDCNDVEYLRIDLTSSENKQNELFALGIRLNQGAKGLEMKKVIRVFFIIRSSQPFCRRS